MPMTLGEFRELTKDWDSDLYICVPDANEDHLHPIAATGVVMVRGEWCSDYTPDTQTADYYSDHVEICW